jgi:hypothetical protein
MFELRGPSQSKSAKRRKFKTKQKKRGKKDVVIQAKFTLWRKIKIKLPSGCSEDFLQP